MRSTRSGAPPRFLPYRSPEYWAVRSEFFVFQILFGFVPLLVAIFAFSSCGRAAARELLDPRDPIHRLGKPIDEEEARRGVVRQGGTIAGADEVCLLIHQYKAKNWTEDFRATAGGNATLEFNDGEQ